MSIRRTRLWLGLGSISCVLLGGTLVTWAVVTKPVIVSTADKHKMDAAGHSIQVDSRRKPPPTAEFEPFFALRLQRPLFDPPPPAPEPEVVEPPPPPPPVTLLATMLEGEKSQAMFSDRSGTILLKTVGDELGTGDNTAQITAINQDNVVLEYLGNQITLSRSDN